MQDKQTTGIEFLSSLKEISIDPERTRHLPNEFMKSHALPETDHGIAMRYDAVSRLQAENEKLRKHIVSEIEHASVIYNAKLDTMQSRIDEIVEIVAGKDAEIARLKAALKPVMEVHLNDGGTTPLSDSICAVAEAKRIMKEGEAK